MPWKESSTMEQRRAFVAACETGEESVAELCRQFEISRVTGHKWLKRFEAEGGTPPSRSRSPKAGGNRES